MGRAKEQWLKCQRALGEGRSNTVWAGGDKRDRCGMRSLNVEVLWHHSVTKTLITGSGPWCQRGSTRGWNGGRLIKPVCVRVRRSSLMRNILFAEGVWATGRIKCGPVSPSEGKFFWFAVTITHFLSCQFALPGFLCHLYTLCPMLPFNPQRQSVPGGGGGGVGGEQRGPSVCRFILCLIKTVELCSAAGLKGKMEMECAHVCLWVAIHFASMSASLCLNHNFFRQVPVSSFTVEVRSWVCCFMHTRLFIHPLISLLISAHLLLFFCSSHFFRLSVPSLHFPLSCCFSSFHLFSCLSTFLAAFFHPSCAASAICGRHLAETFHSHTH